MKKIISIILSFIMMLNISLGATGHINGCTNTNFDTGCCTKTFNITAKDGYRVIDVIVNGRTLDLDVAPVIVNDRTMVPMRAIFEALGAEVNWIPAGIIIATKDELMITMQIDNQNMVIQRAGNTDREVLTLDAPPFISNDRTLVPARAVSEALRAEVEWIPETRTVTVDQMG